MMTPEPRRDEPGEHEHPPGEHEGEHEGEREPEEKECEGYTLAKSLR